MTSQLLHEHVDFKALLESVADEKRIVPILVEKDYWIMHALWGLQAQGLALELKGGTSLSKGFGIIHRFSEDLDIKIEPAPPDKVYAGKNHDDPKHIESRKKFFERLTKTISVSGMLAKRDSEYDDSQRMRNAGIRLEYESHFPEEAGLKAGVLLEVGFDTTQPSRVCEVSSWAWDKARASGVSIKDTRALQVSCYLPAYTFIEKLQAVLRKYGQYLEGKILPKNFLRHYYDLFQLLAVEEVKAFIGTPQYLAHKKVRFGSLDHDVSKSEAFKLSDPKIFKEFEKQYQSTSILYFKGQPSLREILDRFETELHRL